MEMMPLKADSYSIKGPVKEFQMTGSSGQPTWSSFCSDCGSPIGRRSARRSDRVYVTAGSLDTPGLYAPELSIWTDAAQPWDTPTGD